MPSTPRLLFLEPMTASSPSLVLNPLALVQVDQVFPDSFNGGNLLDDAVHLFPQLDADVVHVSQDLDCMVLGVGHDSFVERRLLQGNPEIRRGRRNTAPIPTEIKVSRVVPQ